MSLAAGRRLGPYEILAAIGAGGMGEVYRARDTRLRREVAIKILPGAVASDSERLGTMINAHVSPDGRWLIWGSVEGGRMETYAARLVLDAPAPRLSTQRMLVASGSSGPLGWRADGRELYYADQAMGVSAVSFTPRGDTAVLGTPVKPFTLPVVIGSGYLPPVTGDGRRFIVSEMPFAAGQPIRVLTNWTARLDSAR